MGMRPAVYKSQQSARHQAPASTVVAVGGVSRLRLNSRPVAATAPPAPAPAPAQLLCPPSSPEPPLGFRRRGSGAGLRMPSESGAESSDQAVAPAGTVAVSAAAAGGDPDPEAPEAPPGRHLSRLDWPQVQRLDALLSEPIPIHGRGNFPTLSVQPRQIVQAVRSSLEQQGLPVRGVRLHGSAASHVLHPESGLGYKDLDLAFHVELRGEAAFRLVRDAVLGCLLDFLPAGVSRARLSPRTLREAYVQKLVKVRTDADRWSLISLSNRSGKNVELKFVDSVRRQFEFSVDSFQIGLDPLLRPAAAASASAAPLTEASHPAVTGESLYGDFAEALRHLRRRVIATRSPEEIRGGGLLKYCQLLVRGFRPPPGSDACALQRYMCSRFFIDFPELAQQRRALGRYLEAHFGGADAARRYACLATLHRVVAESTVCLMGHERRQTLGLIAALALQALAEQGPAAAAALAWRTPGGLGLGLGLVPAAVGYYVAPVPPPPPPLLARAQAAYPTWLPCN